MKRVVVIIASGLAVAGCASTSDLLPGVFGPGTAELSLNSEPPGADARTSTGQTCRTPCKLVLPLNTGDFTVTFSAPGRMAQVVPVSIRPPDATGSRFDPNPVVAQLDPLTPPPTAKKKKKVVTGKKPAAKKKTGGAPPPADAGPPPPAAGPGQPPGSPWPPPPR